MDSTIEVLVPCFDGSKTMGFTMKKAINFRVNPFFSKD